MGQIPPPPPPVPSENPPGFTLMYGKTESAHMSVLVKIAIYGAVGVFLLVVGVGVTLMMYALTFGLNGAK